MDRETVADEADGRDGGGGGSPARPVALAAAVLLLLLLVAVASGARGRGSIDASSRGVPREVFDYLFTLGILFMLGGAAALLFLRPQPGAREHARGGLVRLIALFGALMLVAWVGLSRAEFAGTLREALEGLGERRPAAGGEEGGRDAAVEPPGIRWDLVVLVAALLLGGAVLAIYRRARAKPLGRRGTLEEDLAAALDDSLEDLRAERDARRAVVAAYARMERVLAARGLARRPAETPLEYLGRALRDLRVPAEAALDLTSLFEQAKFSLHPIDGSMKDEAIAALEAVRDELRAAEPLPAAA